MISPSTREDLQRKINAVIERAKSDHVLQAQVDEALAAAQQTNADAVASNRIGSGLVGAQYQEFSLRGLL